MTYEFDIKIQKLNAEMTDDEYGEEAAEALDALRIRLRNRYKWISKMYQSGRTGGWWVIEDKTGGATKAKLVRIIGVVEDAKKAFIKHCERDYPR